MSAHAPTLYTVPPAVSFVDALAAGLLSGRVMPLERDDPLALSRFTVLLPTRRACRALRLAFLRAAPAQALLLPRIQPLGDIDEDEASIGDAADETLPGAVSPLERRLLLARLILKLGETEGGAALTGAGTVDQASRLARALAALLDEIQIARLDPETLAGLVPDDYAAHWQQVLRFLSLITDTWPAILAERGLMDPAARRNALLARLAERWEAEPPAHPVIAAGSTGSMPATRDLLATIARLPQGAVVLPGLDSHADDETWEALGPTHPQYALKGLLDHIGVARADVLPWPGAEDASAEDAGPGCRTRVRARLIADAMRPAETITAWRTLPARDAAALSDIHRIDCASPQEEAGVIAIVMRRVLETPGRTAALVTADRALARRVAAELRRWTVAVDDSAGVPLGETAPGAYLRLTARLVAEDAAPVPLLAALKHPLAAGGTASAAFRRAVRAMERAILRGPRPAPGFGGLRAALTDGDPAIGRWLEGLAAAAAPFAALMAQPRATLGALVRAQVGFAEWLAASDEEDGAARLWAGEAGAQAARFVAELLEAASALTEVAPPAHYPALLDALMEDQVARPPYGRHPRLQIWGPLEARLQHADCMILGGLNEGVWPPAAGGDPWMSRPMRAAFGLPPPELRIGLSAHDFVQCCGADEVYLTRARRIEGTPTIPSRWLARLDALLAGGAGGRRGAPCARACASLLVVGARPAGASDRPPAGAGAGAAGRGAAAPALGHAHRDLDRRSLLHLCAEHPALAAPRPHRRRPERGGARHRHPPHPGRLRARPHARAPARRGGAPARARPGALRGRADAPRRARLLVAALRTHRPLVRRGGACAPAGIPAAGERGGRRPRPGRTRRALSPHRQGGPHRPERGGHAGDHRLQDRRRPRQEPRRGRSAPAALAGGGDRRRGRLRGHRRRRGRGARLLAAERRRERRRDRRHRRCGRPRPCRRRRPAGADRPLRRSRHPLPPRAPAGARACLERLRPPRPAQGVVGARRRGVMDGPGPGAPPETTPGMTPAQQRASNPAASVWVGASAGTGKTKVLTDRVLRLLLGGTAPERLLCLTFTRAAAAEMALRIARELARWTVADDEALAGALAALTGARPGQETLDLARRLFATVLDVPDGLKIQTIHAFCQSLLRRFPLEAGVAPNFQIADERMSTELLGTARARLLGAARPGAAGPLAPALAAMTAVVGEEGFGTLLATLSRERERFAALLAGHGGIEGAVAALRDRLGVGAGVSAGGVLADAGVEDAFDRAALAHAARTLAEGSMTDQRRALRIETWLDADHAQRAAGFAAYRRAFYSQKDEPLQRLITTKLGDAHPEAADALGAEQARLGAVTERWNAARVAESSAALIEVAARHLSLYDDEKARHAVLDYGDQIAISRGLLGRAGIAPWVLYKLDGGLDHLLIDEAQDTSPAQWAVIAALADEFFAGEGARMAPRTLFAVGDEKQSIFSFQGADAHALAAAHRRFRQRAGAAGRPWESLPLAESFRSTAAVLGAVDAVFARPAARAGVAEEETPIRHTVHRRGAAGRVELWPPLAPEPKEAPAPWALPLAREAADDPAARLAALIAERVRAWTQAPAAAGGDAWLEARGRPIRAGDVLVLVRRRGPFVDHLLRAFKARAVPVAGIDRMVLTEQLAVMDLIALGAFCLLPGDDLTLAVVLKSPLVELDDDALFALAHGRGGASLWATLARRRGESPSFDGAYRMLASLLAAADTMAPFAFYSEVLGARGGRAALLGRLGPESGDAVEEFLALALAYGRTHPPSLQGFLHWVQDGRAEVARDFEQGRDEVRIMTVHGAKGLEAPVVFLPDTMRKPHAREPLVWLEEERPDGGAGAVEGLLWPGRTSREESRHPRRPRARPGGPGRGIPQAPLRRHDPRRGPALCLRLARPRHPAGGLLVRAGARRHGEPGGSRAPGDAGGGDAGGRCRPGLCHAADGAAAAARRGSARARRTAAAAAGAHGAAGGRASGAPPARAVARAAAAGAALADRRGRAAGARTRHRRAQAARASAPAGAVGASRRRPPSAGQTRPRRRGRGGAGGGHDRAHRRPGIRRALRTGRPGRGAHCRHRRRPDDLRPDRPAPGRRAGGDRARLQERPRPARGRRHGARGLSGADGELPRGACRGLPGARHRLRPALHRRPPPDLAAGGRMMRRRRHPQPAKRVSGRPRTPRPETARMPPPWGCGLEASPKIFWASGPRKSVRPMEVR